MSTKKQYVFWNPNGILFTDKLFIVCYRVNLTFSFIFFWVSASCALDQHGHRLIQITKAFMQNQILSIFYIL